MLLLFIMAIPSRHLSPTKQVVCPHICTYFSLTVSLCHLNHSSGNCRLWICF